MEQLYVITTNRPGPGVGRLIRERAAELAAEGVDLDEDALNSLIEAAEGACEFVELETAGGVSVGPASGVEWSPDPRSDNLQRLGPFLPAADQKQ